MKKLAIQGHSTRGNEVIELLEMLGGKNVEGFIGTDFDELYTIEDNYIIQAYDWNNCVCFTLEEFLEKYPYKVGDQVIIDGYNYLLLIVDMKWEDNTIKYLVSDDNSIVVGYTTEQLNGFKTISKMDNMETKVESMIINFDLCTEDEVELKLGNYEIEVRDGKTYAVKKKPVYPKTYTKCCDILDTDGFVGYDLMFNFPKLINARNAYWKIAGEEMGLGKPWKPDWNEVNECIINCNGEIKCDPIIFTNVILAFPTKEMRDAFYENFKDLIEKCKELL